MRIAAPLAIAAFGTGEEELAGPVRRLVARNPAAASGALPPSTVMAAAASSSGVGVSPDVPPGSSGPLGRRNLGELAVEEGAREAVAPAGAPVVADLPVGRRRAAAGARAEAIVHSLVAESPVGLYVHGRRRLGFAGLGSR